MSDSPVSLLVSVASPLRIPTAASRAAPTSSLSASARRWKTPLLRKPAALRGLGETEIWSWEALADEPGQQTESPSFNSLLPGSRPWAEGLPLHSLAGRGRHPSFEGGTQAHTLESLAQLPKRGGDLNLMLPDSCALSSEPASPQTAVWPLATVQKPMGTAASRGGGGRGEQRWDAEGVCI